MRLLVIETDPETGLDRVVRVAPENIKNVNAFQQVYRQFGLPSDGHSSDGHAITPYETLRRRRADRTRTIGDFLAGKWADGRDGELSAENWGSS